MFTLKIKIQDLKKAEILENTMPLKMNRVKQDGL